MSIGFGDAFLWVSYVSVSTTRAGYADTIGNTHRNPERSHQDHDRTNDRQGGRKGVEENSLQDHGEDYLFLACSGVHD